VAGSKCWTESQGPPVCAPPEWCRSADCTLIQPEGFIAGRHQEDVAAPRQGSQRLLVSVAKTHRGGKRPAPVPRKMPIRGSPLPQKQQAEIALLAKTRQLRRTRGSCLSASASRVTMPIQRARRPCRGARAAISSSLLAWLAPLRSAARNARRQKTGVQRIPIPVIDLRSICRPLDRCLALQRSLHPHPMRSLEEFRAR